MHEERDRPEIFVDADACPVKEEIVMVAGRHVLQVTFVANGGLRPSRDPMVRNVIVGAGFDAADDWIAEQARPGDVVVTNDVPLASRCVGKGALVVSPQGKEFTSVNIGTALAMRDLNQSLRESGAIKGYNAAFTRADRSRFLQGLEQSIRKAGRTLDRR